MGIIGRREGKEVVIKLQSQKFLKNPKALSIGFMIFKLGLTDLPAGDFTRRKCESARSKLLMCIVIFGKRLMKEGEQVPMVCVGL